MLMETDSDNDVTGFTSDDNSGPTDGFLGADDDDGTYSFL